MEFLYPHCIRPCMEAAAAFAAAHAVLLGLRTGAGLTPAGRQTNYDSGRAKWARGSGRLHGTVWPAARLFFTSMSRWLVLPRKRVW